MLRRKRAAERGPAATDMAILRTQATSEQRDGSVFQRTLLSIPMPTPTRTVERFVAHATCWA